MTKEAVTLLKKLIEIPSFSKEEARTADLLEKTLSAKGVAVHRLKNNVWARNAHFDSAKPTLLLNSHHDTVKPCNGWTTDPFKANEIDGKITGLGSNDAGASLVCQLHTFLEVYDKALPFNVILAATAEEEISGKNGIELLLPHLGENDFAIVGEPTGMGMAVAEKGLLVLDCTAHGKAGHAARDEGENAIYIAMQDIGWLRQYRFPNVSETLGEVKMTVTCISAGSQHNVVPDRCNFTIDIRTTDCYSNEEVLAILKKNLRSEVKARSTRLNASGVPAGHPILGVAKKLGLRTFGSPTLSDQALMPFPSVKTGPGNPARSHTADEFVFAKEIEKGIEVYLNIINSLELADKGR
ncbi:MAG: M20 family metallo-hydrolase [Saprospiraceae bacterium]